MTDAELHEGLQERFGQLERAKYWQLVLSLEGTLLAATDNAQQLQQMMCEMGRAKPASDENPVGFDCDVARELIEALNQLIATTDGGGHH